MAVGQRSVGMTHDSLGRVYRRDLHLAHTYRRPGRRSTSLPSPLTCLFVGCKVEGDEEKEVGTQDAHACKGGKLLAGALAVAGKVGKVCRGKVCVGREVDKAYDSISVGSRRRPATLPAYPDQ